MKTTVICEQPIFVLEKRDYDSSETLTVYAHQLRVAEVGKVFSPYLPGGCGRGRVEETAEIVYKNERGVAVLLRREGTTDSAEPEEWEEEPELVWVELG